MSDNSTSYTVKQLKERLQEVGLDCSGNKSELINKLNEHIKSKEVTDDVETMKTIMEEYFTNPQQFGDKKLVHKLTSRIENKLIQKNMSEIEYSHYLFNLAEKRSKARAKNIFLMNIGSSGSHWIEAMLDEFEGINCINEVYFPKLLRRKVRNLDRHALNLMMNIIHLAHLKTDEELSFDSIIVNSAHTLGTEFYRKCDDSCMCIMLTRDPYDIVISRTFRKDSYRNYFAPNADDEEYLEHNIFRVKRWYERHMKEYFDGTTKYENFVLDAENAITNLLRLMGIKSVNDEQIKEVSYRHDRNTILAGKSTNAANLYTGKKKEIPQPLSEIVIEKLNDIRKALNYTNK